MTETGQKKWICAVCGYEHEGPEPPDVCPICGATADAFSPSGEPAAREVTTPAPVSAGSGAWHKVAAESCASQSSSLRFGGDGDDDTVGASAAASHTHRLSTLR